MNSEIVIPMLAAIAVMAVGAAFLLHRWARRVPLQARLRRLEQGDASPLTPEEVQGSRLHDLLAAIGDAISKGSSSVSLKQELTQAGYHHPHAAARYLGAKMLFLAFGVLLIFVMPVSGALHNKLLFAGMAGGMLFFIPNMHLAMQREKRRGEVRRHLPDAIDLLEICASSGMGLDMAWNSVAEEVRPVSAILADEMALTNLEMHLGAPRAAAMRHMAARTGAEELSSLVAVLVQSERFGTSIRDALRTYAQSMRETRSQYAQESAEKMAVKLIFPMVAFIFPAVVMVMAGPGFMMLYKALRAG